MRTPAAPQRSATVTLIAVNVVIFVLVAIAEFHFKANVDPYLALSLEGLKHGWLWQLLTFQFLHAGLLHLLFNSITIYFFGRALEDVLGARQFLKLYFAGGVVGGLFQMLLAGLAEKHFGGAVVGASAGGFALVAAFATMFPDRSLTLLVFFIIPLTMHARTLLWVSGALALYGIAVPSDHIAHGAHLGGMLLGIAWVRWGIPSGFSFRSFQPFQTKENPRELVSTPAGKFSTWRRPKVTPAEDLPPAEFISQEVDPILEKISAHGIHSLTEREREILEKARAKMSKR